MFPGVGQAAAEVAIEAAKEVVRGLIDRLFRGSGRTVGEPEPVPVSGDGDMTAAVERAFELLAALPGIEVTFKVTPGNVREISVRRTDPAVRESDVLGALDRAAAALFAQAPPATALIKLNAPLAASSLGAGHEEVFLLPSRQRLLHRWYWPDPNWSAWYDMDLPADAGTTAMVVAAGSKGRNHQELAVAAEDTVHHCWWGSDGWSGWAQMPHLGTPVADLAFSSNVEDALEIYALDQQGRLRHRWWWRDRGWSDDWAVMDTPDGRPVTAIAAGSYADYHQELFAIVDGQIRHRWWWRNDGWSGWHRQAPVGIRATDIAVSSLKEGHLEVFALDATGRIRHRWYWAGHGWSEWTDLPGPKGAKVTAIAAGSIGDRHQELFGLKESGKVTRVWNWLSKDGKPDWESWSKWSDWHYWDPKA